MKYTCQQYRNRFFPNYILPYFSRKLSYTFSTDGSLMYRQDEINEQTGPAWGMKFIYLGQWNPHINGLNWSLSHVDKMVINAYWYRDSILTGVPIMEIKPNVKYLLTIDSTGKDVIWSIDGIEVHRVANWRPGLGWIHSPWYGRGKNPSATAPHEMRMEICMK